MSLMKVIFRLALLILPEICAGNPGKHIPLDTVEITTFYDTIYSSDRHSIEFELGTCHNFHQSVTVGYKLVLRGEELDINGALLYRKNLKAGQTNPIRLISPFHLHAGDSTDSHRIDLIHVIHKFPFSDAPFSEDDSLVILTDKGNFTLYLGENRRAAAKYNPIITSLETTVSDSKQELSAMRVVLIVTLLICVASAVFLFIYFRRHKRRQNEQVSKLLALVSENEMNSRQLKAKVTDLMRGNFSTINQLCYEYFEKADTSFLKSSIYAKVEEEIEKLKSKEQLSKFEKVLNEFCDDIISRVKTQIPNLTEADITLLIYLYSGLSARTICVLMDIQLKTFYMRRLRLKNKIESTDAPDKEWFLSYM